MKCISKFGQTEDTEIINNLKTTGINKSKAEEQLFKRYSYFVRVAVGRYSLCNDDLIDAYSDSILAVIQSISTGLFKNDSSLKTYIYRIFNNKCIDIIRKVSAQKNAVCRTQSINDMQAYLPDNSISVIEKLIRQSDIERIKENINSLSKNCQKLMLLSADGYTDKEIAHILTFKTADVVKTTRLRCLRKLRQMVCNLSTA